MNTISIDIQSFFSYALLEEGTGGSSRHSVIGDGYRSAIPHALKGAGWGTAAIDHPLKTIIGQPPFYNLYQHPEKAPLFFKGYANRLTEFLGMTEPLQRNGYEPVIVLHTDRFAAFVNLFRDAARQEHCFHEVSFIPSDLALLCRWLAYTPPVKESTNILLITMGETLTTLSLYHLHKKYAQTVEPEFVGQTSLPTGFLTWLDEFGRLLTNRLGGLPVERTVSLYEGMTEFLYRIRNRGEARVKWTGLFKKELSDRIGIPDDTVFTTGPFSFGSFLSSLETACDNLLKQTGSKDPCLILIGGKGAMYPMDTKRLETIAPVEKIDLPAESIALGGLLWPAAKKACPSLLKRTEQGSSAPEKDHLFKRIIP